MSSEDLDPLALLPAQLRKTIVKSNVNISHCFGLPQVDFARSTTSKCEARDLQLSLLALKEISFGIP
jgi:hypothetical protein